MKVSKAPLPDGPSGTNFYPVSPLKQCMSKGKTT